MDEKNTPDAGGGRLEGSIESLPGHNTAPPREWPPLDAYDDADRHYGEPDPADLDDLGSEPFAELDPLPPQGETMPTPEQAEDMMLAARRFVAVMVRIATATWQGGFSKPFVFQPRDHGTQQAEEITPLHEIAPAENRQPPRSYDEILSAAHTLASDADPATIETLAIEASGLSKVEADRILRIIKQRTGTPMGALRALVSDSGREKPDDLTLARQVLDVVGRENIFAIDAGVYSWQPRGVWRPVQDIAVKQLVQHGLEAITAVNASAVSNVSAVLRTEVYIPWIELNMGDPSTVNTLNGELVLTGAGCWELRPHNRSALRTTQIPVKFDRRARAPRFMQFLNEIFRDDPDRDEKIECLLQLIGYSLMSHCRYEKFVILIGNGANGKSVFLAVLEALLGIENVSSVQPSKFDDSFYRAHLYLRLVNLITELKEGEVIADAALKSIVSGESTTASHKYQHPFDFRPYATCWFGTNHMPHTRDFSDALFRRAVILKFNRKFDAAKGEADPLLKERLIGELPGILNLALDAYARWVCTGNFTEPKSSQSAKGEWRLEADQVQQFCEDCCSRDPRGRVQSQQLYNDYRRWADECGISQRLTQKSFVSRLERLGFGRARTNAGKYITGIIINSG